MHSKPAGEGPTGTKPECSVDGCPTKVKAHGLCHTHYMRLRRVGSAQADVPVAKKGTNGIGYDAAHDRVRALYGKAHDHLCACGCGKQAEQFAYDHSDPDERVTTRTWHGQSREVVFSADPTRYLPMTRTCHTRMDRQIAKTPTA